MTEVAVMQPTFLPWLGYFDLMDRVDRFVYLDTVQFTRQSWQHRNRIRTAKGLSWLTAPVKIEKRLGQPIDRIELGETPDFPKRVLGLIGQNYRDAPHRDSLEPIVARLERAGDYRLLCNLVLDLLADLREILGVTTPVVRSSALDERGERSELVVALCRAVAADVYVSPPGSLEYLADDLPVYESAGLPVLIHQYRHPEYPQQHAPFEPYASVIDLIANVGPDALDVIRSGRLANRAVADCLAGTR